ncbi:MAG: hypothetical protein ABL921_27795 [Pirellula sp.]
MSEFDDKLKQAAARGANRANYFQSEAERKRFEIEEFRAQHTKMRLELSDRIETVIKKLIDLFPGFRYQTVFGEAGWGGACLRDDLSIERGRRENKYSRFEMAVRPLNEFNVLDLQAKGTIANRELMTRSFYQPLGEVDLAKFKELIESWALTYAELYAANR